MVVLKVGNVRMLKIGLPVLGWSTCSSFTDRANWSLLLLICQFYLGFSLFGWINWCLWIITLVWNMLSKASGAIGILEYPESLKVYCGCLLKCRDCSMVLTVSSSIGMKIFFPCLFVVVGRMCVWETLCETTARVRVRLCFHPDPWQKLFHVSARQFETDLTARKSSIKLIIQEELTKLADEVDDEDEEGDAEKDEAQPASQEVEAWPPR